MERRERIFVAAWEYPPVMSGESVVCRRTLEYSAFDYDVCCALVDAYGGNHVQLFPVKGSKYFSWPFRVVRAFRKLDEKNDYKVMMSRVMPPNGHWAGLLIKWHKPKLKWIVYFSDPIWNSPFLHFSLWNRGDHRPNWFLMKLFGIPAQIALKKANLLVFNNSRLARYVLGKQYEKLKSKVLIAPYGHEGVKPCPAARRNNGKVRLAHVGQIYGNRTLRPLLDGAEQLMREEPGLFRRLELRQIGFVCEAEQKRIRESPAAAAFTQMGQVSYKESIEAMYSADWLLVIDPLFDTHEKDIYIPGKIYDYMSTGRPVLCICERGSATEEVAVKAGMPCVSHEGSEIFKALKRILAGELEMDSSGYASFTAEKGAGLIDEAIARLLGDG